MRVRFHVDVRRPLPRCGRRGVQEVWRTGTALQGNEAVNSRGYLRLPENFPMRRKAVLGRYRALGCLWPQQYAKYAKSSSTFITNS
eukprot:3699448-Prymnesium_polylepis.3